VSPDGRGRPGPACVSNLVGGEDVPAASASVLYRENPACTAEQIAICPDSGPADAAAAAAAAASAAAGWAATPPVSRAAIVSRALDLLRQRSARIVAADIRESGKTLAECRSEVERAIGTVEVQVAGLAELDSERPSTAAGMPSVQLRRVPAGVAVTITPWNFPFSAVLRKVVPALLTGNAVVAKPSELTPVTAAEIGHAFREAGLPASVLNIVHGTGAKAGAALVTDPAVNAVSFTGSTGVGLGIATALAGRDVKVQLEMGGKNAMVVLADADLDRAVADCARAAFTAAGQWCVATSRLIVERAVYEQVASRVATRADQLVIGNGADPATDIGPVVSAAQYRKVRSFLDGMPASRVTTRTSVPEGGYFVAPAVLAGVDPGSAHAQEEIFGPVLAAFVAEDLDEAVALANNSGYGLSASIYTRSATAAEAFASRAVVNRVGVNLPTSVGDPAVPSSGRRGSGRGEPEGGVAGLKFFTHPKSLFRSGIEEPAEMGGRE
jgi:alpha-ketoglutaric semialdehyde dehydrogenase